MRGGAPLRLLAAVSIAAACTQQRDAVQTGTAAEGCAQPVLVAFANAPGDTLFADLERASGARLEARSAVTATLYALIVAADGAEPACTAAVDRLRQHPRVRSVDADTRREPHERESPEKA